MNWTYPKINAIIKDVINIDAKIKTNPRIMKGIYFIGIKHGIQQKVVCWSGFCDAWYQINIITNGNIPNENIGKLSNSIENIK